MRPIKKLQRTIARLKTPERNTAATYLIYSKVIGLSGAQLKEAYRQRCEFEADRRDPISRIRYMAQADGYVMVRRPGKTPFVLKESVWRGLEAHP